ncbi:DUF1816 domain-containing protein, partial [Salmonella enterica]
LLFPVNPCWRYYFGYHIRNGKARNNIVKFTADLANEACHKTAVVNTTVGSIFLQFGKRAL